MYNIHTHYMAQLEKNFGGLQPLTPTLAAPLIIRKLQKYSTTNLKKNILS